MKKAKVIMTVVVLLAITGGTLAFKTARFNGRPLYTTVTLLNIGGTTYQTQAGQLPICTFANLFATAFGTPVTNPSTYTRVAGDPASTTLTNTVLNQTIAIPYVRCIATAPISGQTPN